MRDYETCSGTRIKMLEEESRAGLDITKLYTTDNLPPVTP